MRLFYEDEFDAIASAIGESGKAFKEVAAFMFPDLKPDSAYARLKVCLNPEGDQKLTFGQVVRLMKFLERYDPLMHACDETWHARPDRKAPKDEKVKLVEAINGASETLQRALKQLEVLQARANVRSVA